MQTLRIVSVFALAGMAAGFGVSTPTFGGRAVARASAPVMESFYDFSATAIDGTAAPMSAYKGKPVLILNVASL